MGENVQGPRQIHQRWIVFTQVRSGVRQVDEDQREPVRGSA